MADFVNDNVALPEPKNEQTVPLGKEARFIRGQDYNALRDAALSLRTAVVTNKAALASETSARVSGDTGARAYIDTKLAGIGAGEANAARITAQETHTSGWVNVKSYEHLVVGGDWTAAFLAAVAAGDRVIAPPGAYPVSGTITLGIGKSLVGSPRATRLQVKAGFAGPVVKLAVPGSGVQQATLQDIDIEPATDSARWTFKAVQLVDSNRSNVTRVRAWYPDVGFEVIGASYWNELDVDVYKGKTVGVDIVFGGSDPGLCAPNNNTVKFRVLGVDGPNWNPTTKTSIADSWAIRVHGSVNRFVGGEPTGCRYGVEFLSNPGVGLDGISVNNRLENFYLEYVDFAVKAAAGTVNYVAGHFDSQATVIDPDAVIVTEGQDDVALFSNFMTDRISAAGLKALYLFNEGAGTTVVDHSGNGRTLTTMAGGTPVWRSDGIYGPALDFDATAGTLHGVEPVPLATLDWTQPFTVALLVKSEGTVGGSRTIFSVRDAAYNQFHVFDDAATFDKVWTYPTNTITGLLRMSRNSLGWAWHILYIDPVARTVTSSDPVGYGTTIPFAADVNWAGLNSVQIGRYDSSRGLKGLISFAGFWQRKLSRKEILHLVNLRVPYTPAPATRAAAQADSTAADVATMKADFNALLVKLRAAGVIAP
jgi:hypothetical protein